MMWYLVFFLPHMFIIMLIIDTAALSNDNGNWLYSSVSPSTDMSDQFPSDPASLNSLAYQQQQQRQQQQQKQQQAQLFSFETPEQALSGLIFPMDNANAKAVYNDDIAQRLDYLQNMMDTDGITPSQLNINISSEQQLADMNAWLGQLSESIGSPGMLQQDSSIMNPTAVPLNDYDMLLQNQSTSSPSPLQQQHHYPTTYHDPSSIMMYPTPNDDMYVRSTPVQQPTQDMYQQEQQWMNTMVIDQQQQQHLSMTTGHRQHYTATPDLVPMFQPDVRSTMNFTSAKGLEKYNNPSDAKVDKEETESFKPTKPVNNANHVEEKQNLTTMINVFSSSDGTTKNGSNSKTVPAAQISMDNNDDEKTDESNGHVTDLLVTFNDLSVSDDDQMALYPVKSKFTTSQVAGTTERDNNHNITTSTTKSTIVSSPVNVTTALSTDISDRHRQLLNQVSGWINDIYNKKKSSSSSSCTQNTVKVS
ncbi:unnamed protein product [Absidia cylindrospora]